MIESSFEMIGIIMESGEEAIIRMKNEGKTFDEWIFWGLI